ncbi:hypothetical protein CaCOL14_000600 [Colletotrichum acutatum]
MRTDGKLQNSSHPCNFQRQTSKLSRETAMRTSTPWLPLLYIVFPDMMAACALFLRSRTGRVWIMTVSHVRPRPRPSSRRVRPCNGETTRCPWALGTMDAINRLAGSTCWWFKYAPPDCSAMPPLTEVGLGLLLIKGRKTARGWRIGDGRMGSACYSRIEVRWPLHARRLRESMQEESCSINGIVGAILTTGSIHVDDPEKFVPRSSWFSSVFR